MVYLNESVNIFRYFQRLIYLALIDSKLFMNNLVNLQLVLWQTPYILEATAY